MEGKGVRVRKPNPIIAKLLIKVTLNCHQAYAKSLIFTPSFTTFSQISTSVLPTPIAVASMRCVTMLLDRMHAHVKQDIQEMEEHALVRCFDLFLKVT